MNNLVERLRDERFTAAYDRQEAADEIERLTDEKGQTE